jgi:hypothetical protein
LDNVLAIPNFHSNSVDFIDITTGIEETENSLQEFRLFNNYPNPFNPNTKIKFNISQDVRRETRNVTLKVYDILGNEVATLVNEKLSAGEYEITFDVETSRELSLTSGIYFYTLRAGEFFQTKKMILLK